MGVWVDSSVGFGHMLQLAWPYCIVPYANLNQVMAHPRANLEEERFLSANSHGIGSQGVFAVQSPVHCFICNCSLCEKPEIPSPQSLTDCLYQ